MRLGQPGRDRGVLPEVAAQSEDANPGIRLCDGHETLPGGVGAGVLHEDDFAGMRINWSDKAENIVSIADELNLGLEHILFIDDNPVECEWIKDRLPAIQVLHSGEYPFVHSLAAQKDVPLNGSTVIPLKSPARSNG